MEPSIVGRILCNLHAQRAFSRPSDAFFLYCVWSAPFSHPLVAIIDCARSAHKLRRPLMAAPVVPSQSALRGLHNFPFPRKYDDVIFDAVSNVRGGYIIPKQQPEMTTLQTRANPFTLLVALDQNGEAYGDLCILPVFTEQRCAKRTYWVPRAS